MEETIIYKDYDQEALDRQYNNRARVPEFEKYVQLWDRRSAHVRQHRKVLHNIRYGPGERELLDIIPAARSGAPVQVFFHGGYWQAMDKAFFHFIADGFVEHQITTVVVNYPLAPRASMDEIIRSCSLALTWLYRHGASYSCDPDRIFVSGHSAGGHIVAMLMATDWKALEAGLPSDLIKGGCSISGLFDLTPIRLSYLNDVLGLDEATAKRNSPVYLSPTCAGPLILSVGEREPAEYHAQSNGLSEAWSRKGLSVTSFILPAHNHFSSLGELADKGSALNRKILVQHCRHNCK